jgi:hypothetical protein
MFTSVVTLATILLLVPAGVSADEPPVSAPDGVIARPIDLRLVLPEAIPPMSPSDLGRTRVTFAPTRPQGATQPTTSTRSWAARHPVALGFLIGAGTGAVIGAATCGPDSSCDYGRAAGAVQAAIPLGLTGALAGWVIATIVD